MYIIFTYCLCGCNLSIKSCIHEKINKLLLLLWGTKRIKVAITQFISFEIIKKKKQNEKKLFMSSFDGGW